MVWLFATRRERLRREAADWVARLNGPHGEEERAEFERWRSTSPDHGASFDRLSGLFEVARQANRPAARSSAPAQTGARQPKRLRYAYAAAVACAALLAFFILSARTVSPDADGRQQFADFAADQEASRRIRLADGSEVLLSPGSILRVALGNNERRLRLTRGEGRFSVMHEARPFIVAAEDTQVLARGTQFVVRLGPDRTTIALIEGQVDVSYAPDPSAERRVARLRPGEQIVVETGSRTGAGPAASPPALASLRQPVREPASVMLQFDETPLGRAVEQANRHGSPPIRLADAELADLRITGAFQRGDTRGFAASVAAAFSLQLERGSDGALWLRPSAEASPN